MYKKLLFICFVLLSMSIVNAQRLCEALVENALDQAGANCTEQDGEISCYAYDSLSTTFFAEAQTGAFVAPGSVVELDAVHTIQSLSVDLEEDEWGIAYLQSRANLEAATADSSVRLIMLGDVFMENGAEGGASVSAGSVGTVFITIAEATPLLDSPSDAGATVADGTSAMVLEADGLSGDGLFVRADLGGQDVWVSKAALFPNEAIDGLATVDAGTSAPASSENMTAFANLYFTAGGDSDCQEAPNMLIVQGPTDKSVDITINDVPIRIGSTIALGMNAPDGNDVMWVTVLSGQSTLYPDTPQAVEIPEGYITEAFISPSVGAGATAILDKVTGAPIMSASGIPYVRRVPTTLFTVPEPLIEDGTSYKNTGYYNTPRMIPDTLLNYPIGGDTVTETVCTLNPIAGIGSVNAHIGPDRGRSVRTIYEETAVITNATETTADDGSLWYEIETESFGLVYVSAEDVTQNCETTTRIVSTECLLEVRPDVNELWGHVGPGYNRNVSNFFDITLSYVPTGRVDVDGVPWFEVPFSDTVNLWVDGSQFVDIEGCDLESLAATPPPIIAPVKSNTSTPVPQSTAAPGEPTFTPIAENQPTVAPATGDQPTAEFVVTEEPFDSPAVTEEFAPSPVPQEFSMDFSGCNGGNGDGTETMTLIGDPPAGTEYLYFNSYIYSLYTGGFSNIDVMPEDQPINIAVAYDTNGNHLGTASGFSYSC